MASTLERYLTRYGSVVHVPPLRRRYRHVLTIPAFDERVGFLDQVLGSADAGDALVIVTVNAPEGAERTSRERTAELMTSLRDRDDVIVIDRVTEPIPRRQGVGLARKLAADLACWLIARGDVVCPILFMTDADVTLPAGYFEAAADLAVGTMLFPFRHHADDQVLQTRADVYELHLANYVDGLTRAGSPYAFQTLGSTIAIQAGTYARVRGIPRRNAGEDFYLLNKAAKVDPMISLNAPEIVIHARASHRVPFGTGPALQTMPDDVEGFVSYPDDAFDALSRAQAALEQWALRGKRLDLPADANARLTELGWHPERLERTHPAGAQRLRACFEWFDGFRTMRFVRMATRELGERPLLETLRRRLGRPDASPAELVDHFRRARRLRHLVGVIPATRNAHTKSV